MADFNEEEVADYQEDEYQEYEEQVGEEGAGLQAEDVEESIRAMEAELGEINQSQQGVVDQLSTAADRLDENSMYLPFCKTRM